MGHPLIALFATIGLGLLLGNLSIRGISLGSSGVLFAALLCGHLGYALPDGVGKIGLVLFVYCVGIGAGGRFFNALAREGSTLAKLAVLIVGSGAAIAYAAAKLFDIPAELATGIFAGALTSTPALAAATESGNSAAVSIGYGIAYPLGEIGVVLFVQVLPRILNHDLDKIAREADSAEPDQNRIERVAVDVTNPNLYGKRIAESGVAKFNAYQVSRIVDGERAHPLQFDDCFNEGQTVILVGRSKEINIAIDYLGRRSERNIVWDSENEVQRLVITSKNVIGQTLHELAPLRKHHVILTRITRLDLTFAPTADTRLENHDVLTVVGEKEHIEAFSAYIGHRSQAFDETDLLSLSLGLTLGIIAGMIPVSLPGSQPITLGLAGGPLFVALLLGHFGRVGRIVGHIPRPTRLLLQEMGLVLFLAEAGVKGGSALVETVQQYGAMLFAVGAAVTLLPMLIAYALAGKLFKLNPLQALGGICGGMTSTPALGAITAKTDSQIPIVSYATAYPVALIVMTVFAKLLLSILGVQM